MRVASRPMLDVRLRKNNVSDQRLIMIAAAYGQLAVDGEGDAKVVAVPELIEVLLEANHIEGLENPAGVDDWLQTWSAIGKLGIDAFFCFGFIKWSQLSHTKTQRNSCSI